MHFTVDENDENKFYPCLCAWNIHTATCENVKNEKSESKTYTITIQLINSRNSYEFCSLLASSKDPIIFFVSLKKKFKEHILNMHLHDCYIKIRVRVCFYLIYLMY